MMAPCSQCLSDLGLQSVLFWEFFTQSQKKKLTIEATELQRTYKWVCLWPWRDYCQGKHEGCQQKKSSQTDYFQLVSFTLDMLSHVKLPFQMGKMDNIIFISSQHKKLRDHMLILSKLQRFSYPNFILRQMEKQKPRDVKGVEGLTMQLSDRIFIQHKTLGSIYSTKRTRP